MVMQTIINLMDSNEQITVKGKESGRGFTVSAYSLKNCLYEAKKVGGNKRGGITITVDEPNFVALAKSFGYNI